MRQMRVSISVISVILLCIGVVMIFSSSGIYALQNTGQSSYYLKRHLLFLSVGFFLAFWMMTIDYRVLQQWAKPLLLIAIGLLILVHIPGIGYEHYGARRWFKIGPFSFQPSEFAKLAVLIYFSDFLSRKQNHLRSFKDGFLPAIMVLGIVCVLILKQPDLGTSLFIAFIAVLLLFIGGVRMAHLGSLILLALPFVYLLVVKVPYRMKRIAAFINPWEDSHGIGFQLSQSQIALGSGGIFGVGLGKGMQKLFYLPAAHTDFIFSIIGEELGLIGTLTVIVLFIILIWQGARIAKRTKDSFGFYLSSGIVAMIGFQAMINIGVSIGALPTKGLPLPFISYGGSALILNMVFIGLLLSISRIQDT